MKALSKRDAILLLDIIQSSLACVTEKDFRKLVNDLNRVLYFDYAVCLMGKKSSCDAVTHYDLINISYPDEWLYYYVTKNYHLIDPIVKENFSSYSTQFWHDTYKKRHPLKSFVKEAEDFDLREGYSIGQRNLSASEGSLFSFAGRTMERGARTEVILQFVTPHLHRAFNQVVQDGDDKNDMLVALTDREREILHWIKEGKSTWDISAILAISQDTVKFHIKNIYRKLNVTNRSHALAIALGTKLIEL